MRLARSATLSPTEVSDTPSGRRTSSDTPSPRSSARIAWLTAGWVISSCSAARVTLPVSATGEPVDAPVGEAAGAPVGEPAAGEPSSGGVVAGTGEVVVDSAVPGALVTASNRAAMVYRLPECGPDARALAERLDDEPSVGVALFREGSEAVARREREELRFSPGDDGWLLDGARYIAANYADEITAVIRETVERWDADEASRKIELAVGRDLQFIRINGTVVGSLAGLAIYTVSQLLFS